MDITVSVKTKITEDLAKSFLTTAVEGGIISSTRILLAALLGSFLVSEPALTVAGWLGALLIFGANVVLAARKTKNIVVGEG